MKTYHHRLTNGMGIQTIIPSDYVRFRTAFIRIVALRSKTFPPSL